MFEIPIRMFGPSGAMFVGCVSALVAIMSLIVHIVFALGVYDVATRWVRWRRVYFAGPVVWSLATLIGGVFVAAVFWLLHFSTLSAQDDFELDPPINDDADH